MIEKLAEYLKVNALWLHFGEDEMKTIIKVNL